MTIFGGIRRARAATARFWGSVAAGDPLITWLHEPTVRRYVNACVSGDPDVWPLDALAPMLGTHAAGVSFGCGDGTLERWLRRRDICRTMTALDISERSLDVARQRAREEGIDEILYRTGDFNALEIPEGAYGAAFFQQSLHHVENLEGTLEAVARCLTPRGLLYLDEYVGPSRSEWNRALLEDADAVYRALPRSVRRRRRLALPVDRRGDPSEAIRSSEILAEVASRFDIEVRRDYGGTFLSVIYPHLDFSGTNDPERAAILESIVAAERSAIARGAPAYYTVIVARLPA